jgi:hypothetical protein
MYDVDVFFGAEADGHTSSACSVFRDIDVTEDSPLLAVFFN